MRGAPWLRARFVIQRLLGSEEGGCVITPFDKRWLDPRFREMMAKVRGDVYKAIGGESDA